MAIQLSERDNLIFRFIDEHQVLLEKHIAWFISCDDKPVLIRDRLRKLFYLDYLLCERHGGKLPWWTTPTKPLVYMLSPMSRQLAKAGEIKSDLNNAEIQRHLLEVANLRMLYLMDQKEQIISALEWTTIRKDDTTIMGIDAVVNFKRDGAMQRIGIMNHPAVSADLAAVMHKAMSDNKLDGIWVVSRDDAHQSQLQKSLVSSAVAAKLCFTTHQEVYKSGICKAKWQPAATTAANVEIMLPWSTNLSPAQAF
ncbi:MAG TPA: hypothetical protein V6D22_10900 [Candidatus Obscuribacterales bacterium]